MAKTLDASLILSLIDRVSSPSRAINASITRLQTSLAANTWQMNAMRGQMFDAAAAGYALYQGLAAPITAAMDFESTMADVRKVVDFDSPEAFAQMGSDIIDMSLRLPIAANGIAEIVAAAGQAGIAGEELMHFTEGAAKIGVAFDISAGEAGDAMAKLRTALGYSNEEVFLLADSMNHLSNAQASGADEILRFVNSTGAMASGFGLTAEQAAAFGSAMISSGADVDVAATSFQNMGAALVSGVAATADQKKAFTRLGLSAKNVASAMQVDAQGTIIDVLERINELPADVRQATIFQLFGKNADALLPLITNMETLDQALAMVSDQTLYAGSAQKEFEVRASTTANSMQLFRNNLNALAITIGAALLPALNDIVKGISPVIRAIAEFAEQNPVVVRTIVAATAALVALNVASIAARYSFLWMKGGVLTAALGMTKFAGAVLSVLNPLKLVTNAMKLMRLALVSTGIGAVVVGLALAGTWIYNNWNGLGKMFTAFGEAFTAAVEPVEALLRPVIQGASKLFGWMSKLTGELEGGKWTEWGTAAGTAVGGFVTTGIQNIQTLIDKIVGIPGELTTLATDIAAVFTAIDFFAIGADMITQLWEGIKSVFGQMAAWVQAEIAKMFANIPNPFAGWGAPANSAPMSVEGADLLDQVTNMPTRAAGGPVSRGMTALVGEEGPEFVTFPAAGYVHPNGVIPRAPGMPSMSGRGGASSGAPANQVFNVNVAVDRPNASAADIAREVSSRLGRDWRGEYGRGNAV